MNKDPVGVSNSAIEADLNALVNRDYTAVPAPSHNTVISVDQAVGMGSEDDPTQYEHVDNKTLYRDKEANAPRIDTGPLTIIDISPK